MKYLIEILKKYLLKEAETLHQIGEKPKAKTRRKNR